mmetsp:Transcript_75270/g.156801  ORF Transcript_75270/g.156801 Transcript_75270/m.156801 type:complete len:242 (+) Transcript_75270:274-999(+)
MASRRATASRTSTFPSLTSANFWCKKCSKKKLQAKKPQRQRQQRRRSEAQRRRSRSRSSSSRSRPPCRLSAPGGGPATTAGRASAMGSSYLTLVVRAPTVPTVPTATTKLVAIPAGAAAAAPCSAACAAFPRWIPIGAQSLQPGEIMMNHLVFFHLHLPCLGMYPCTCSAAASRWPLSSIVLAFPISIYIYISLPCLFWSRRLGQLSLSYSTSVGRHPLSVSVCQSIKWLSDFHFQSCRPV